MSKELSEEFFKFLLESEGKRAIRYTYFFSILTVELDQNQAQSQHLSTVAKLIQESIRNTDLIGKIDDHRFSVILHHAEAQSTYHIGERIRDRVANYNFLPKNRVMGYTISVGGACFPTHTPDIQSLLVTATEMLFRARSEGGNQVCLPPV